MRKAVYVLNVNDYAPRITEVTYPFLKGYAKKIGAEWVEIRKRRFPEWPVVCEKLQIYDLAREGGWDWNIYFDSDTLVHPETIDWTEHLKKDTVAQNGHDFSSVRHRHDKYFLRDGRNIGTCGWLTIASDWCLDLWHPCEDMTPQEVVDCCYLTVDERNSGVMDRSHLSDDYIMSRNIARYGLKYETITEMHKRLFPNGSGGTFVNFLWHAYTITEEEKVQQLREILDQWALHPDHVRNVAE